MNADVLYETQSIKPERLRELSQAGKAIELIDVRTPAEYRATHASIARCVPLQSLDPQAVIGGRRLPGEPLYLICRTGERSAKACGAFAAAGHGDTVVSVEGGTVAWEEAGLPVVRGRFVLPLDRQVRIAAGILVLLGAVLGFLVNPWFYALSAYCGAGLIFAGVTDICPLGWTIAKMPWNQGAVAEPTCCRV